IVIPPAIFFYYSTLFDSRFKTLQQNPTVDATIKANEAAEAERQRQAAAAQEQANQVAAAQTPQQNNEQTVYIAPDHGTKYHLNPNCSGLNNANSVVAISLQEAQARGYTLCKRG
ncbi:hypothetical protein ACP3FU_002531, partial [Enterococcus hirae]